MPGYEGVPPVETPVPDAAPKPEVDAVVVHHRQPPELVRRHQRLVFGAAFRIVKDATVAEDVAQETPAAGMATGSAASRKAN